MCDLFLFLIVRLISIERWTKYESQIIGARKIRMQLTDAREYRVRKIPIFSIADIIPDILYQVYPNSISIRRSMSSPKESYRFGIWEKIWAQYSSLPTTEIWSDETLNVTLKQILFYALISQL